MKRKYSNIMPIAVFSAVLGGVVAPQSAAAQVDQSNVSSDLELILVTARRQEESLQEVPITISVLGGDVLERYQLNEVADLESRIPNLTVQIGGSGSGGQVALRGVGSSNISTAFDSAVALNFDGVIINSMRFLQAGFFDTKQIEVLKGPQSLFFGKSATAGVLSLLSNDPTDELEIIGRAAYEFEENGYLFDGRVSGPVTDRLGVRLAAQYNDIQDFASIQPGIPAADRQRGIESLILRGTLLWEAAETFTANLKVNYNRLRNDGALMTSEVDCGADGLPDPISIIGLVSIPAGYDCNTTDQLYAHSDPSGIFGGAIPPDDALVDRDFDGQPFGETEIFNVRLKLDLDITDDLAITSVTGYFDFESLEYDCFSYGGVGPGFTIPGVTPAFDATNAAGSPQGVGCSSPNNRIEQFSQELRVQSDLDGPFNFMVGGFFEDRTNFLGGQQNALNISIFGPDPLTGFTTDWYRRQETQSQTLSFFVSGQYDITDRLNLSGGIRYTDESRTSVIEFPYVNFFLSFSADPAMPAGFVPSGFNSGDIHFDDSRWTPEVALTYSVTQDINVFAAFKSGFKSGGLDNSGFPSTTINAFLSEDAATRQAAVDSITFDSETTIGGEIGMKGVFANGALRLNATAFYYVFDDLQLLNFDPSTTTFVPINASQIASRGVETDFAWTTPVEGLSIVGAGAILNSIYTQPFAVDSGPDRDGDKVDRAPTFTGNIAADYTTDLGNDLVLGLNGNVAYTSSYTVGLLTDQSGYATVDATVSFSHPSEGWRIALVATNLTDQIWTTSAGGRPFVGGGADDFITTQNRGRQVFLEGRFAF